MTAQFQSALATLRRFAPARNRLTDREPRTVMLTDDEALALLEFIEGKEAEA